MTGTEYLQTGELSSVEQTDGTGRSILQYWTHEPGTKRLRQHQVLGDFDTVVAADRNYTYDHAGNIMAVADKLDQYDAGPDETQCFQYDHLRRLKEAWTQTPATCAATPSIGTMAGPAPYWNSYSYDLTGNRTSETERTPAGTTTSQYTNPASGANAVRPHTVSSITATGVGAGTTSFTYDNAGNTKTRSVPGKPAQTLTWDPAGRLASVSDTGGTTSYVYDPDGNRLAAKEPSATTLFLGSAECRATGTTVACTRLYGHKAAGPVASRGTTGLYWQASDHQGTAQYAFRASDMAKTQRRTTPFGEERGTAASWPTSRGFVGGVNDRSGLVQVGARQYDPGVGRFLSIDPLFNQEDPQSWHGYAYANNTPVTASDPSGLQCLEVCGGSDDRWYQQTIRDEKKKKTSTPSKTGGNDTTFKCPKHMPRSDCYNPKEIMSVTIYKKGTVLAKHRDGTWSINGYFLPGVPADADALARDVDEQWNPEDGVTGVAHPLQTTGMIKRYCWERGDPNLCSTQLKRQVERDHQELIRQGVGTIEMVGLCVSVGVMTFFGGSATGCVVKDAEGWGLLGATEMDGGWGVGASAFVGPVFSNGNIKAQEGRYNSLNGSAGYGGVGGGASRAKAGDTVTYTFWGGLTAGWETGTWGEGYTWTTR